MTGIDFAILGVLVISIAIGVYRGFLREVISLGSWILAFVVALTLAPRFAPLLPDSLQGDVLRLGASAAALFVLTLIVGGLVSFAVQRFVQSTGLTVTDRALGAAFGAVRSVVIVGVLVQGAGLTPLPKQAAWQDAVLLEHFRSTAIWLKDWMPEHAKKLLTYS